MGNRYWPAFYLIDRQGRIVATRIGELHEGQARADDFERHIRQVLAITPMIASSCGRRSAARSELH